MLHHIDRTEALHRSSNREAFSHDKIERAIFALALPPKLRRRLEPLLIDRAMPPSLPLSNQHVREASRRAFIDTILAYRESEPTAQLFLATFGGARGATPLSAPVIDLVAFQRAVYAVLRRHGLTGFFSFEFDVVLPSLCADHTVLFHCHGIVRQASAGLLDVATLSDTLAASAAFLPWDGAPGVDLRPIGPTTRDVCTVAVYLEDPFHQLKRVQPNRHHPDRNVMRSTRAKLTPALALRAAEIQSHLSVRDAVFGVGDFGAEQRRGWRRRLMANLPRAAAEGTMVTPQEVDRLWRHIHAHDGSAGISQPVALHTRSAMLRMR